jgi:nitroimidazol reductase NimA-like FMN-containing flavoprotein (pyridoxamine 5'-phosphate oxidase superfamily)
MALCAALAASHTGPMMVDEGLELLTEDEARELLATGHVGRVGLTVGALPAIFPVNYRLIDGAIVFRTSPGSKMSAATTGAVVAFEVDDYQLADRTGWSVLAVGRSEVVHDPDTIRGVLASGLEPMADGCRNAIVRIEPTFVSGRRISHDPGPAAG